MPFRIEIIMAKFYVFTPCGTGEVFQGMPTGRIKLDLEEAKKKLGAEILLDTKEMLIVKYKGIRVSIFKNGKVLVKNLDDKKKATNIIEEIYEKLEI